MAKHANGWAKWATIAAIIATAALLIGMALTPMTRLVYVESRVESLTERHAQIAKDIESIKHDVRAVRETVIRIETKMEK